MSDGYELGPHSAFDALESKTKCRIEVWNVGRPNRVVQPDALDRHRFKTPQVSSARRG